MLSIKRGRREILSVCLPLIPAVLIGCHVSGAETIVTNAPDSTDLLLNLFIEKGYVTKAEADAIKVEAEKRQAELNQYKSEAEQYKTETDQLKADMAQLKADEQYSETNTPGSNSLNKWLISPDTKSVELFGDIRMRYEYRDVVDANNDKITLQRYRYALRFGLHGQFYDDYYYGFRLETSSNPRSSFVTLGTPTSSSTAQYPNPFTKSTGTINVGQVYIGWHQDWMNITLGKMPNPLYTTPMVWSPSINPEGAAETFKHTVGEADFFATFGQFIYQSTNPNETSSGYLPVNQNESSQPLMLAIQGGVNYKLTKSIAFKVAPVLYDYTTYHNGQQPPANGAYYSPDFSGTYVGQGSKVGVNGVPAYYNYGSPGFDGYYANQTGINDLLVLEIPLEFDIKLSKVELRLFSDYAQNLDGGDRANAAYDALNSVYFSPGNPGEQVQRISSPQTHDIHAYQVGFGIGSTNLIYGPSQGLVYGTSSKKNAWEFRTYWQHIEQYSLDPNLLDTDFFNAVENMQGVYVALSYGLADNVIATVRYGYAQRINDNLGTGGSSPDIGQMNPINDYSIFQFDLGVRF
jgi:hypothetical protein